jgi:hypothetical protein
MVLNTNRHDRTFVESLRWEWMFIGSGRKKDIAVKTSGIDDRVNASSRFPLLLTAPEVFVLSGL